MNEMDARRNDSEPIDMSRRASNKKKPEQDQEKQVLERQRQEMLRAKMRKGIRKEIIREKEDLDQKAQIKLLYTGTVLDEGDKATPKRLVDYNFFNEAEKWSGPWAGILWVAPELQTAAIRRSLVKATSPATCLDTTPRLPEPPSFSMSSGILGAFPKIR